MGIDSPVQNRPTDTSW